MVRISVDKKEIVSLDDTITIKIDSALGIIEITEDKFDLNDFYILDQKTLFNGSKCFRSEVNESTITKKKSVLVIFK